METSLDENTARTVHGNTPFGVTIVGIQLADGTRVDAICDEEWCSDISKGQTAEIVAIPGSDYSRIVRLVDQRGEQIHVGEGETPLPHSMLPGISKTIQNAGFECDHLEYAEFNSKPEYVGSDFNGQLEYCAICKKGANYKLLQSSDDSFQVLRCANADCGDCVPVSTVP